MSNNNSHKIKAVDINIESLKLYITLSTVSIAGILSFYSGVKDVISIALFSWSIVLFILCAVFCVVIVNHFIIQANDNTYNVRTPLSRILNFLAIFLFIGGMITGSVFISRNIKNKNTAKDNGEAGSLVINEDEIKIGEKNTMKVFIQKDSLNKTTIIKVNYD